MACCCAACVGHYKHAPAPQFGVDIVDADHIGPYVVRRDSRKCGLDSRHQLSRMLRVF